MDDYRQIRLDEIAKKVARIDPDSTAPVMMISAASGFINQSEKYSRDNAGQSLKKYTLLKKGELAYNHGASKLREFGCCFELKEESALIPYVYHAFAIRNEYAPYIAIYLNNPIMDRQLKRLVSSSVRMDGLLNISYDQYMTVQLNIPNTDEQIKLFSFISTLDSLIEKQKQLVNALKSYKRGLLFSIFKHDNPFGITMSMTPMRTLLEESHVRETQGLRVCSVAVEKGVVDQVEHLGRSFAASDTSKYGRVEPNYVVYTKSPTGDFPYGIVKQNRLNETVAVSPLYGVYKPRSSEDGTLLHYYFEQHENANNYIRSLAQKGAKNTINITTDKFLDKDILYPANFSAVKTLVHTLDSLKLCIETQSCLLEELMLERKTLLSLMFI